MEEYVLASLKRGLMHIVFLEHMEEGIITPKTSWLSEKDFDYYFEEGRRLQEKYRDKIEIGLGVECGYNPDCKDVLLERINSRNWDLIGISCHFQKIEGDQYHFNLLSKNPDTLKRAVQLDTAALFSKYLDTLLEAIDVINGSMLCHLDAPFRWLPSHTLSNHHYQKIDHLLGRAAAKNLALEINTSGIAIRNEAFPNKRILEMASKHQMTFQLGSDAHKPEDVGNHFKLFS